MPRISLPERLQSLADHRPDAETLARIVKLRRAVRELAMDLYDLSPVDGSREESLAFTALEEVQMWAIKGIVRHSPGSVVVEKHA